MGDSGLVPETCQIAYGQTSAIASSFQHCQFTVHPREETSPVEEAALDGMSAIRKSLENQGISNRTKKIMLDSWRSGTKKQYDVYLGKWNLFASRGGVDPIQPPVSKVLDFLTELYDCGLGYSAVNTARCALSTIITLLDGTMTIGSHPLIQRFIKAAFQTRPAFPRYQTTWDTSVVLNFLKEWHPVNTLALQHLTFKLVMLCALTTGQRCQSFHFMSLSSMQKSESSYTFVIDHLVKSSAPGQPQPVLVLPQFPADSRLCVVTTLEEYLRRTAPLRGNGDRLFISYISPYKSVSLDTIGRWIKTVMALAGIVVQVQRSQYQNGFFQ